MKSLSRFLCGIPSNQNSVNRGTKKWIDHKKQNVLILKVLMFYKMFVNSVTFMDSSLSCLTDNLTEGLLKGKCKNCKSSLVVVYIGKKMIAKRIYDTDKNIVNDAKRNELVHLVFDPSLTNQSVCNSKSVTHVVGSLVAVEII